MEYKSLGNTEVMIPEIGLGTWKYTGGVTALRRGIELGAFLIDTAEMYSTEGVVGEAIRGIRDKAFVATKVLGSHLSYNQVMRAAEESLRRLGTDYIDLYQIHWPNSAVPIEETMGAMETLVDSGLVRYVGVSNFSVGELQEAQAFMAKYPIVSNQVLYNLKKRDIEKDLIPYCQENQITIMAYTPLAEGSLTTSSRFWPDRGAKALGTVAAEVSKTPAQVALNWCISKAEVVAIPKSNSVARTEENCGASGWRLSSEQMRTLDEAFQG